MRSRAQLALSLLTLIALLKNCKVQASDSCGTRNWRCGDICIPHSKPCLCGGGLIQEEEQWCCSEKPCTGLGVWQLSGDNIFAGFGWSEGGNCSSGNALHLSQPCE